MSLLKLSGSGGLDICSPNGVVGVHVPFINAAKCKTVRVDLVGSSDVAYVIASAKKDPELIDLGKNSRGTP